MQVMHIAPVVKGIGLQLSSIAVVISRFSAETSAAHGCMQMLQRHAGIASLLCRGFGAQTF